MSTTLTRAEEALLHELVAFGDFATLHNLTKSRVLGRIRTARSLASLKELGYVEQAGNQYRATTAGRAWAAQDIAAATLRAAQFDPTMYHHHYAEVSFLVDS